MDKTELDKLIEILQKEKGGSYDQYRDLIDRIAFAEVGSIDDITRHQDSGGPGRGKLQYESGKGAGGKIAANRLRNYYNKKGVPLPDWLKELEKQDSVDASTLTSDQQDLLFLGNMIEHPEADMGMVFSGEQSVNDFWLNYHWAGVNSDKYKKDTQKRRDHFASSQERYNNKYGLLKSHMPDEYKPKLNGPEFTAGRPDYRENPEMDDRNAALQNVVKMSRDSRSSIDSGIKMPKSRVSEAEIFSGKEFNSMSFPGVDQPQRLEGPMQEDPNRMIKLSDMKTQERSIFDFDPNNAFAMGGVSNSIGNSYSYKALTRYNTGGSHEQNKHGGIPQGVGPNGKPNTVEEGETSFDLPKGKYVFSDRLSIPKSKKTKKKLNDFDLRFLNKRHK